MADRTLRLANTLVKVALAALLAHAVLFPDLPQYAGKGIGARLVLYPLGVPFVPRHGERLDR